MSLQLSDIRRYRVFSEEEDLRLDVFLAQQIADKSRSYIQSLIKDKKVMVNGKNEKASYRICEEDEIEILIPPAEILQAEAQNLPLMILYEDSDMAVVYKERGMVVHPAPGNYRDTLVNALLYHMQGKLSSINGVIRPGIVHRIDKDTSGLLMVAKTDFAHRSLSNQLKEHSIRRRYTLLCFGALREDRFTVDAPIGRNPKDRLKMAVIADGKPAVTHIEVLERSAETSYAAAILETGRTHQIRVHMAYSGYPLIGDRIYGPSSPKIKAEGQMLHAGLIGFVHPVKKEYMEFSYPEPEIFLKMKNKLLGHKDQAIK